MRAGSSPANPLPGRLTMTVEELASALNLAPWTIYAHVRRDDFPVPAIRVGRRILFATATVRAVLGIDGLRLARSADCPAGPHPPDGSEQPRGEGQLS